MQIAQPSAAAHAKVREHENRGELSAFAVFADLGPLTANRMQTQPTALQDSGVELPPVSPQM